LHISKDTSWLWNSDEIEREWPSLFLTSEFKTYFPIFVLSLFSFLLIEVLCKIFHDYVYFAKFWKILVSTKPVRDVIFVKSHKAKFLLKHEGNSFSLPLIII